MEQAAVNDWRIVDAQDLPGEWCHKIAVDVFDEQVIPNRVEQFLTQPNHAMFLAVANDGTVVGQVRGIVTYQPDDAPQLYLDNLGLTPAFKRRGIGTALVEALSAWGQEAHQVAGLWLGTEVDNEEAHGLYGALGFTSDTFSMFEAVL